MTCVIPFSNGDAKIAVELLEWIATLGGCKRNPCLLVAANHVPKPTIDEVLHAASSVFREVDQISPPGSLPDERWPRGAGYLFKTAALWCQENGRAFWWLEPDCIPLKEGWLETLEAEYYRAGKPFLGTAGDEVKVGERFGRMVNGGALYPADTATRFQDFDFTSNVPWDIWMSERILPDTHVTPLVQHFFGKNGLPPTFRGMHVKGEPENVFTLEQVRPQAVVFHRNKDGTLIGLLRQAREIAARPKPIETERAYYHSGNLGDLIYGLNAIRAHGPGKMLIGPEQISTARCDKPIREQQFALLKPLLAKQPYLTGVEFTLSHPRRATVYDLNNFRTHWNNRQIRESTKISTLCAMHCFTLRVPFDETTPWLTVPDPIQSDMFVVHRSARYHNPAFPWVSVYRQIAGQALFTGLPEEHAVFQATYGKIPYWQPKDFLELARMIAGSRGFIGNQSLPCAIAIGCGQRILQESWADSPDCLFAKRADFLTQPFTDEQLLAWLDKKRSLGRKISSVAFTAKPSPAKTVPPPPSWPPPPMPTPLEGSVAISVVCYNRLDLTRRCLELLWKHTPGCRVIVTNNASWDGTREFLDQWQAGKEGVTLVHNKENLGYKDPHNSAYDLAMQWDPAPDFFCILNNDMEIGPDWRQRALEAFAKDSRIAIVGNSVGACSKLLANFHGTPGPKGSEPEYVEGSMLIIRTAVARKIGLFDPHLQFIYGEDSDLSLRAREAGYRITTLDLNCRHLSNQTIRTIDLPTRTKIQRCQTENHAWLAKRWAVYLRRRDFHYQVAVTRKYAMGDVIDVTAILPRIKQKWPLCDIHVCTNLPEIFANNPNVKSVTREPIKGYDYNYDLQMAYERRPTVHTLTAYADVCEVSLPLEEARLELFPSSADTDTAARLLPRSTSEKWVVLHNGPTNWRGKDWPFDRWEILAQALKAKGWSVALVGTGPHKVHSVHRDLRRLTSIPILYSVIKRTDLFVGLDSGPSHLAQAAQVPTVVLFGTILAQLKLLPQPNVVGVQADQKVVPCVGEHHRLPPPIESSQCQGECMRAIKVEMVMAAVDKLFP